MKETAQRISILDLETLREAFKISAREHHVEGPEWGSYAEHFLKDAKNGKAPQRGIAGALAMHSEQKHDLALAGANIVNNDE